MKYLYLLLILPVLCSCSLIRINEAPQPPKHRPEIITVTEYLCNDDSITCQSDDTVRIARDKIEFYGDGSQSDSCNLKLLGIYYIHKLKMSCSDFDALLNQ